MSEWEKKPYKEEANRIREERLVDLPGYKSFWGKKREEPMKRKSSAHSQRHTSPSLTQRASINRLLPGHSPLKILTAPLPGQRLTKMSAQVLVADAIPVNRPSPTQPASPNLLLPGHSPLSILTSLQAKAVLPSQRLTEMPAQVLAADATPVNLIPLQVFTLNASGLITPTQRRTLAPQGLNTHGGHTSAVQFLGTTADNQHQQGAMLSASMAMAAPSPHITKTFVGTPVALSTLPSAQVRTSPAAAKIPPVPSILTNEAHYNPFLLDQLSTINAFPMSQQVYSTGALDYVIFNLLLQSAVRISNLPSQPAGNQTNCLCALCVGNKQKQWIQPSLN